MAAELGWAIDGNYLGHRGRVAEASSVEPSVYVRMWHHAIRHSLGGQAIREVKGVALLWLPLFIYLGTVVVCWLEK